MPRRKKSIVDWKSLEGAFAKPRRLQLVKGSDGREHCPINGCEHLGFSSRRGCRKHVKTKHPWYYYFNEKPAVATEEQRPLADQVNVRDGQASKIPCCSKDTDFARLFSQWLQSSCGGGKSPKQSDSIVVRALKFIKFGCDDNGYSEEELFASPNLIDYSLGSPELLTKFVDSLEKEWNIGQSGRIGYVSSIVDLMDFRKFNRPPMTVLQNFSVTEIYLKRARKFLARDMRSHWRTELDIETLESRRCWATLSDIQSVIPYHEEHYNSVLENCMISPASVKPSDITFATRFVGAYLFLKVKGCRPMTYQHMTLPMFENAKRNGGIVDQQVFKTAKRYGFDSLYLDKDNLAVLQRYVTYVRPLLKPKCEYVLVNRNGAQVQKMSELLSILVFDAIGKYIHPTRYRQIIETESAENLLPMEQKWISEDQKHSSNVARVHYQKKRSRQVAVRGRQCFQKLLVAANAKKGSTAVNDELPENNDVCEQSSEFAHKQSSPHGETNNHGRTMSFVRFTSEEDNYLKLGLRKFGSRWTQILRDSELTFHACRVPNTLMKRAKTLKLV